MFHGIQTTLKADATKRKWEPERCFSAFPFTVFQPLTNGYSQPKVGQLTK